MQTLRLTALEADTLQEIIDNSDVCVVEQSNFSNVGVKDLANLTSISIKQMRGVVSSLIKKGFVYLDDVDGDGTELVYLDNDYLYLAE
jgi:hypothetical protein